jgi:hypothetical protein
MFHKLFPHGSPLLFDRYIRFLLLASGSLIMVTLLSSLTYGKTYDRLARLGAIVTLSGVPDQSVPVFLGCFLLLGLFVMFLAQPLYMRGRVADRRGS